MHSVPWIILLGPLVAAFLSAFVFEKKSAIASVLSVGSAALNLILAIVVLTQRSSGITPPAFTWIQVGDFTVNFGLTINPATTTMLLIVTLIGFLVHLYSLGYMREDAGKSRYFAGLSLFMFSMLGIVLADNFVMMFVFWELVGVSSYLLIGHWFQKKSAADAAFKAFSVNRIGDFGFMIGILLVWSITGALSFDQISSKISEGGFDPFVIQVAAILVFCGAVGKSAQLPLHVWLPDAMEGPTPVSALIHAATMVAAGVFMLVRVDFLVNVGATENVSSLAQTVIMWVGTATAIAAALMALQQDDIKRILAYSTLSQLGYMVAAVGLGAGSIAMFHLYNHAFFKALLFLCAGSVIVGMHHEQNIWKMGCLMKKMMLTFATMAVGTFALCAVPWISSGGASKDLILEVAGGKSLPLFAILLFTGGLTTFYMLRLVIVAFFGKPRSEEAKHAHEAPMIMLAPLAILALLSLCSQFFFEGLFGHLDHPKDPLVAGVSTAIWALVAILFGAGLAFALYHGKDRDPVRIGFFANRLYIDAFYDRLVRHTQDAWAGLCSWLDRWILDGVIVGGVAKVTWGVGFLVRFFQTGNLQGYAFLFGAGVVALLYFTLFGQ